MKFLRSAEWRRTIILIVMIAVLIGLWLWTMGLTDQSIR